MHETDEQGKIKNEQTMAEIILKAERLAPLEDSQFNFPQAEGLLLITEKTAENSKMKYMKIGTRPDIFHTEEATRSVSSDVPSDLTIIINNSKYLLHKFPLLPKCGLLQRLYSDQSGGEGEKPIEIHDIPGGEEAFELCAKFCYEIVICLSAHNFVSTFCAAKFLKMTESVEQGNFLSKLEHFLHSFILNGWKDSIAALETTAKLPEWSENLGIIRSCVDSIVDKILTHPSKVTWSYTYTRPGYSQKPQRSVPRDWWTEDISDLDIELFRCIIASIRSLKQIPPPLIGEALHVYASRWLPQLSSQEPATEASALQTEAKFQQRRILNSIVSMIPTEKGSVSVGFLLKLLKAANLVGSSPSTKGELIRRSGQKLDEASVSDLLFLRQTHSNAAALNSYDMDLVGVLVESFLMQFRDQNAGGGDHSSTRSLYKVAKLIDQYLQVLARTVDTPVSKFVALAESLPEYARPEHDELYKAINTYLKEHPEVSKGEKKRLCQVLDCGKLSVSACMHALRNERLPLRTLVQLLFIEQARSGVGVGPRGAGMTRSMADTGRIPEIGRTTVRQGEGYRGGEYRGRDADGGLVHRRRGKTAPGHQRGMEAQTDQTE